MNKTSKEKTVKITKSILTLIGLSAMVASVIVFPGLAHVFDWLEKEINSNPKKIKRAYKDLKSKGMVKVVLDRNGIGLRLTALGKKRFLKYEKSDLKILKPVKWDQRWRIVMFDIPEDRRNARDFIRLKLKNLGFAVVQKSVFVHPYPCKDAVEFLRDYYSLKPGELYIFVAEAVEGDKYLRNHFKL